MPTGSPSGESGIERMAGLRILILEDEPIIAMAIEDALQDAGVDPVIASTLERADALIAEAAFDAAVLDVNIHGRQSYGLAARLLESGVPFVFASGYGGSTHPPEFADIPTVGKPYEIAAIAEALSLKM